MITTFNTNKITTFETNKFATFGTNMITAFETNKIISFKKNQITTSDKNVITTFETNIITTSETNMFTAFEMNMIKTNHDIDLEKAMSLTFGKNLFFQLSSLDFVNPLDIFTSGLALFDFLIQNMEEGKYGLFPPPAVHPAK